jgi:hypothetical protein
MSFNAARIANGLVETAPPGAEPLTLDDAKLHLRVTHDGEDALIATLVTAARVMCEDATGLALITRGYSLFLDRWPAHGKTRWWDGLREGADLRDADALLLPRPPLAAVECIRTIDDSGSPTVYDAQNYAVDTVQRPGRIVLKDSALPPQPGRAVNGIEIRYQAGFGATPQSVPPILRQGMRQIVAFLFENRGDAAAQTQALAASGASLLFQSYKSLRLS